MQFPPRAGGVSLPESEEPVLAAGGSHPQPACSPVPWVHLTSHQQWSRESWEPGGSAASDFKAGQRSWWRLLFTLRWADAAGPYGPALRPSPSGASGSQTQDGRHTQPDSSMGGKKLPAFCSHPSGEPRQLCHEGSPSEQCWAPTLPPSKGTGPTGPVRWPVVCAVWACGLSGRPAMLGLPLAPPWSPGCPTQPAACGLPVSTTLQRCSPPFILVAWKDVQVGVGATPDFSGR